MTNFLLNYRIKFLYLTTKYSKHYKPLDRTRKARTVISYLLFNFLSKLFFLLHKALKLLKSKKTISYFN